MFSFEAIAQVFYICLILHVSQWKMVKKAIFGRIWKMVKKAILGGYLVS